MDTFPYEDFRSKVTQPTLRILPYSDYIINYAPTVRIPYSEYNVNDMPRKVSANNLEMTLQLLSAERKTSALLQRDLDTQTNRVAEMGLTITETANGIKTLTRSYEDKLAAMTKSYEDKLAATAKGYEDKLAARTKSYEYKLETLTNELASENRKRLDSVAQHSRKVSLLQQELEETKVKEKDVDTMSPDALIEHHKELSSTMEKVQKRLVSDNLCSICQVKPRCVLLSPCKHACVCQECSPQITKCPICREVIADRIKFF